MLVVFLHFFIWARKPLTKGQKILAGISIEKWFVFFIFRQQKPLKKAFPKNAVLKTGFLSAQNRKPQPLFVRKHTIDTLESTFGHLEVLFWQPFDFGVCSQKKMKIANFLITMSSNQKVPKNNTAKKMNFPVIFAWNEMK